MAKLVNNQQAWLMPVGDFSHVMFNFIINICYYDYISVYKGQNLSN